MRTTGRGPLRPSCTCTRGLRPLDPVRRYCKFGRKDYYRQFRWGYGKFVGFWPKKAWKNPRGRASFPPGVFPGFPRMLCIRDGGSFRRLNRRKSAQRTLLVSPDLTADEIPATGGHRRFVRARSHNGTKPGIPSINSGRLFSRQTKQHPPMRVQGGHPPGQVWAESSAYPLCWPCRCYILPFIQMLIIVLGPWCRCARAAEALALSFRFLPNLRC